LPLRTRYLATVICTALLHTVAMRFDEIAMPARIAARPKDPRGYPVPAITPWHDGVPQFAISSPQRALICAKERRCSVCALEIGPGPVWRVVSGAESEAIEAAHRAGHAYVNRAPTVEAPGHRLCMLYAALVCPFLARPNARRGADADLGAPAAHRRGEARGEGGAVIGYASYQYAIVENRTMFRFSDLVEHLPFGDAVESALHRDLDADRGTEVEPGPRYLLTDESETQSWKH
jgi:hypothetical protein